jgi:hypothetical protein
VSRDIGAFATPQEHMFVRRQKVDDCLARRCDCLLYRLLLLDGSVARGWFGGGHMVADSGGDSVGAALNRSATACLDRVTQRPELFQNVLVQSGPVLHTALLCELTCSLYSKKT